MTAGVTIPGTLRSDAQARTTAGATPHALLMLEIQPAAGAPVVITHDLGPGEAAHITARSMASRLRKGAAITAYGDGIEPAAWDRVRLTHCTLVLEQAPVVHA